MPTCSRCGDDEPGGDETLPLGWSLSNDRGGTHRLCAACTRAHARAIEAKLSEEWWDQ